MRIDIITGLPKLLESPLQESILRRAQDKGKVELFVHDLREYTHDKHKTIDDTPYGGGAGMVLKPEPVFECVEKLQKDRPYDEVILLAADGEQLTQSLANELSLKDNIILVCGHYKGVDERVRDMLVTRAISIGDYVLTGGELPAMILVDCISRQIPGVLGKYESLEEERVSSSEVYTRPEILKYKNKNYKVPKVLLSGHHKNIENWKKKI